MPKATEMTTLTAHGHLLAAARERQRVRVKGRVLRVGDGFSGRYRNRWIQIATLGVNVQVTASKSSTLGAVELGTEIDIALSLTGLVDVADETYYGRRAQLIALGDRR